MKYEAIVIGASTGGFRGLCQILPLLPVEFALPIIIAQHRMKDSETLLEHLLDFRCMIHIKQAEEKELIQPGKVYFAPPDYHILIESDQTLSLSIEPPVCHARPSINVLFETAADVYGEKLAGIILSGNNNDGQQGARYLKRLGGLLVVQDPLSAEAPALPKTVIAAMNVDHILPLHQIGSLLLNLPALE